MTEDISDLFIGVRPWLTLRGEDALSNDVAFLLRTLTTTNQIKCVWFHVPNELVTTNKIEIFRQRKRKAMGVIPGAPDYVIASSNKTLLVELKTKKNTQTPKQKLFQKWCKNTGVRYLVARSVDDILQVLREEGILKS